MNQDDRQALAGGHRRGWCARIQHLSYRPVSTSWAPATFSLICLLLSANAFKMSMDQQQRGGSPYEDLEGQPIRGADAPPLASGKLVPTGVTLDPLRSVGCNVPVRSHETVKTAGTKQMQKFVIQGGSAWGDTTAAGNKNAALPIRCILTEEVDDCERTSRTPRPSWRCSSRSGSRSRDRENTGPAPAPGGKTRSTKTPAAIRASFLAGPPRPVCLAEMPPPGGDFIGRRRPRCPPDAFRDLGASVGGADRAPRCAALGLKAAKIFMDEPLRDGHRKRPDGSAA